MNKIKVLIILMLGIFLTGCQENNMKFKLEEKYYTSSSFQELNATDYKQLQEKKESFVVFIYQNYCATSSQFESVLNQFINSHSLTIYKMSFSDMKKTDLNDHIKYYPSFAIIHNGELVDYLDANDNEDTNNYKETKQFKNWISEYIYLPEEKENNFTEENKNDSSETNKKIDTNLENVTYDKDKVNIYFFWGDGCPHCKAEFQFFQKIEKDYGEYYKLNTFEVWNNKENASLLKKFANIMGDKLDGVPYTIIGNKTFTGFKEEDSEDFIKAIKEQHNNSYDIYFQNK